jgi:AbiTii
MGRQEEALRVAEELVADIELERLKASEIVLKANRVARLVGHDDLLRFLSLERNGYKSDGTESEWIGRAGRWSDDDDKFYSIPLAKIEALMDSSGEALKSLQGGGNYSGEYASIAGREHDQKISAQAKVLGLLSGICGQVVATVYDMVVEIYHELLFSELQASLFAETQTRVDGSLAAASGSALNKIERVSDRLRDGDAESVSQALTTCRRLIDSCASHLFPAGDGSYDVDGQLLKVGEQNVLNRLQAHAHSTGAPKGRRDRLRRTLSDLYGRCSAGTHAEVSTQEARFVFLQTYVVLGEVLTLGDG